ncbi:lysophospholipid transporter LplT [Solemya pervernicosa gill symbiont]|uniref:Lysophospholipid transporter LplT n=1 Tax=Solemya pervernicosa gill symbiont TaxID=642797 RepID=A0A1T2L7H6_9GAMM|nr:lysophospholipid transporter LplT [Solemya pervernicosa gill symbiont]OOZ41002.1 lysophospholipid transporter LplT [Solemya pervernicosa gill symbiont]
MNRGIYTLMVAQFLTAFADNAILFAAFAMLSEMASVGEWYKPALQGAFLLAFVVLAPWVGRFADRHAKRSVLTIGNAIKALGALLLMLNLEPLLAYAVVGIGAAVYGPAKYGILPELTGHKKLVKANALIEGSTIIAIVLGAVIGANIADQSISYALLLIVTAYLLSLVGSLLVPKTTSKTQPPTGSAIRHFGTMMARFFTTSHARFSMLGASIFWAAAVVLRVMMVAWAPAVLLTSSTAEIANLTVFIAIGIALGAFIVPWLVPIERLRRARVAAYVMGALIVVLATVNDPTLAKIVLLLIGMSGGIFVVPINAALQELGHRSIGAGGAVAIQNFFENLAMLAGTGLYTLALGGGIDPVVAVYSLGALVIIATTIIAWHLPKVAESWPPATSGS